MYQELKLCKHFRQRDECNDCKKINKKKNRIGFLLNQYKEDEDDMF